MLINILMGLNLLYIWDVFITINIFIVIETPYILLIIYILETSFKLNKILIYLFFLNPFIVTL